MNTLSIKTKRIIKICLLFIGIILSLYILYIQNINQHLLKIIFFDIGQGDAILIITPDNKKILIDGGPDNTILNQLGEYLPFYDKDLDLVILSHAHADHLIGLIEVLKRYPVHQVLYSGDVIYHSQAYQEFKNIIKEKNISLSVTTNRDVFKFSAEDSLITLYPFTSFDKQELDDLNDSSVVNKYCYLQICVLLTGDMPDKVEQSLLAKQIDIGADIIKLGHHGSQYSSSENFLMIVNPSLAVIQVGQDNKFNHPHLRTLKKLARLNISVLRNDVMGQIVIISDGKDFWFQD